MGTIPALPAGSSVGTEAQGPARASSGSPAPSLDGTQSRSESRSPARVNGIQRSGSLADMRGRPGYPEPSNVPYPVSPQMHQRMPSPSQHAHNPNGTATDDNKETSPDNGNVFREPRDVASTDVFILQDESEHARMESPTPLSPMSSTPRLNAVGREQTYEGVPKLHISSESYSCNARLPMVTSPTSGLGKSPFRKAPPKPLELPQPQLQNQHQPTSKNHDSGVNYEEDVADEHNDGRTASPDENKGTLTVPMFRFASHGPLTAPPTRAIPAPYLPQPPMTPNPSSQIKAQFIRVPGVKRRNRHALKRWARGEPRVH